MLGDVQLDSDACRRAVRSRDVRFDGRFVVGVRTTGVYCRPSCPAPAAKPENVAFYATPAAAEAEGLRPCRRCRPELAPPVPEWNGAPAAVTRGLRLIAAGYLTRRRTADLARELGVTERELRRLFLRHLGASPARLDRTARIHLARALIDQTDLSLAEVARAAGFASASRLETAIAQTFRRSPADLQRRGERSRDGWIELRLAYREPFAWDTLLSFLAARAIPGVEEVRGGAYRRTIAANGSGAVAELRHAPPYILLRLRGVDAGAIAPAVERARRLLDLYADPGPVDATLRADPLLAPLVDERPGLRVPGSWDGFELAVRGVLGQQVSVSAARTLAGRLASSFGVPLPEPDGTLTHVFPGPQAIADAAVERIGVPRARAEALRRLARAIASGELALDPWADAEATRAALLELPGIGPWTAEYVALRGLGDPDAFPAGDLGLRRAGATPARAEAWRPWRAYAAIHLWAASATLARKAAA